LLDFYLFAFFVILLLIFEVVCFMNPCLSTFLFYFICNITSTTHLIPLPRQWVAVLNQSVVYQPPINLKEEENSPASSVETDQ